jgi:hypothetical protein
MINDYLVRRSAANHNNVAKEFMRPKINSFAIQNQASHRTAYFILSFSFYGSSEAKFPDKVQAEHCLMLVVRDCVFLQIRLTFTRTCSNLETVNRDQNLSRGAVSPANDFCGSGLAFTGKSWSYWQNQA